MTRSEIERALENICESKLGWESLEQYLIRLVNGDPCASDDIESLVRSAVEFNREQDAKHVEPTGPSYLEEAAS